VTFVLLVFCTLAVWCAPQVAGAANPMLHNSDNLGTKYGTWGVGIDCSFCHANGQTPTTNIKKVKETITTSIGVRPVIFKRMTAANNATNGIFGNDERTYNVDNSTNYCEVCHHQTIYHQYSSSKLTSKSHTEHKSNRKDCTQCHNHRIGFKPPPPGDCSSCHGNPPTDPSQLITNELGPTPPADAGAHFRHRLDQGMQCGTCHNNFGHGLLGNDFIEFGFKIDRTTWPNFEGTVTSGTITATNNVAFNNRVGVATGNSGTVLNLTSAWGATCAIYCHGDGWNIPSGKLPTGQLSWTNGPLGACSNAVCHGTTPANPPTPSVASGAHTRHVGTNQYACTTCHDNYTEPHMVNGKVKWNLTSQGGSATYKGFNAFSTNYLATTGAYGSCANVYCHSSVQGTNGTGAPASYATVTWGGSALTCNSCHASPMTTGSHTKHTTGYNNRFVCSDCHSGAGKDNEVKHADGTIDVAMSATYGGTYSQAATPPNNGFGTCSTSYCHSDGNGGTVTVSWGATTTCASCHGGDLASGSPVATGKHTAHINNAAVLGSNYGCADCHASTVTGNTAIGTVANHVNKFKDYSGPKAGKGSSYNTATGVCSASYCHTDGKGAAKGMTTDNWKAATTLDCKGCHGSDTGAGSFASVAGEPNYSNSGSGQPRANSHDRHMGGLGLTVCVYCHGNTMAAGGTIVSASTTHTNKTIDVAPGGGKTFTWTAGTKTCSTIVCHGGPAPATWGQLFPADCTGCHGNNASSAIPQTSGKHAAHMNNVAVIGTNYGCVTCHALTVSNDRAIADPAYHGNGFKNITGQLMSGRSSYASATGVCSASYCHTDGKGTQKMVAANNWKSAATLGCTGCHGSDAAPDFASSAGEPNYSSTGAGTVRANSHKNHVDAGAASCVNCHAASVTVAGTAIATGSTVHANKGLDVVPGGGKSFTWTGAGKTCSDISCHGGKGSFTQTWGAPLTAECIGCHGNNAASAAPIASGKHTAHMNNAAVLGSNYNCSECHAKTINVDERSFAFPANHGNGFRDYSGVRAGRSSTYSTATGVCSATYCHTDGKGTQKMAAASNWNSATTLDCKGCHGSDTGAGSFVSFAGEPNYSNTGSGQPRANSHERHMGGTGGTTCIYCHGNTMAAGGTIVPTSTTHTNKTIDVAPGGGKTFTWTAGTKTCSTIVCHGGAAPATWGQAFPTDCTGCHGNNASSAIPQTSGKHAAHMNNVAVIGTNYGCVTCHALTVSSDRTIADPAYHGNGFKNITGQLMGGRSSYASATGVCSATYCHTDGKGTAKSMTANNWKSAAILDCSGCHGSDANAGSFTSVAGEPNYSTSGTGTLRANTHQQHVGSSGAVRCVNCHATTVTVAGTAIAAGSTVHADKTIDVVAGGGKSFTFTAGTKTCNNISCHGAGSVPAQWGATMPADCTGCHGGNAAATAILATGKHTAHMNNTAVLGSNYGCADCHALSVSADRTIVSTVIHGNGFVDYSGIRAGRSSSYSTATGVCSATYCHTDGKGTAKSMTTDNWKAATTLGCTGCHGSDAGGGSFVSFAGEPNYSNTGSGQPRANSHERHMGGTGGTTCIYCHGNTMAAGGTIIPASTTHTNKTIDVAPGGGKTFTWTAGTKTCSTIVCHGGAAPATWGQAFPADCTGCHGNNASSAIPQTSGKHAAHMNNVAVIGTNYGCVTCHALTVSSDRAIADPAYHGNGFKNITGQLMSGRSSYASATGVCSASYCHTDGKGTQKMVAANNWKSAATLGCNGCHGADSAAGSFASVAGEPNYSNGGSGAARANSHQAHVKTVGASTCVNCHNNTVTSAGTAIIGGATTHANKTIDVVAGGGKTFTWSQAGKTCSSISCHGGANATWGDPTSAGCNVCHGSLSAAHGVHINDLFAGGQVTFYNYTANKSTGTVYRFGCSNCHPTDVSKHQNSVIDVTINKNKVGGGYLNSLNATATADGINVANSGITGTSGSNVSCASAYCHSNGRIIPLLAGDFKASPNWYSTTTANRCGMCHDNPPQYTTSANSHYVASSSLGNNGTAPYRDSGHMVGIHFKNNAKGNNRTGFLGYSSSGSMAHGNPALSTTISCYICHNGIVSSTTIDTYAMNGTGSKFRCGSCHTAGSRTPLQNGQISNTALHINGTKNVTFAPVTIKTKAQLANQANALGWNRNGSYKADDSYDSADLSLSTWTPGTKTCLTACHVNQPNITWGATLQCVSCHANQ
jgi:predicted CxxxxCH...CXXCH cytochrome family protein